MLWLLLMLHFTVELASLQVQLNMCPFLGLFSGTGEGEGGSWLLSVLTLSFSCWGVRKH